MNVRNGGITFPLIVSLFLVVFCPETGAAAQELSGDNVDQFIAIMEKAWDDVENYTTVMYKKERHGGELLPREKIFFKFRKPMSIYMEWVKDDPPRHKNPNLGQEMIYERGWNNNKIYAHPGKRSYFPAWLTQASSWVIDFTALDPDGRIATMYQRHKLYEVPFGKVIKRFADGMRTALNHPEDDVTFLDRGYRNVMGEPSSCIEVRHPPEQREAYYGYRITICMDLETKMPSQIRVATKNDKVLENVRMVNTRINVGLGTSDFRPDNPEYRFE